MQRRDVLRLLALHSLLPAISPPLLAAFREVHAGLGNTPGLKAFNAHQNATVIALTERIIPETDTPGAKSTRVNEFIDRIVADWLADEERSHFLAGLAEVDARAQKVFAKDFVTATSAQQAEILRALGDEMLREEESQKNAPRGYRGAAPEPESNFYFTLRNLTLMGYFTSEAGFTQQLREAIIPGHYDGCTPVKPDAATETPAGKKAH